MRVQFEIFIQMSSFHFPCRISSVFNKLYNGNGTIFSGCSEGIKLPICSETWKLVNHYVNLLFAALAYIHCENDKVIVHSTRDQLQNVLSGGYTSLFPSPIFRQNCSIVRNLKPKKVVGWGLAKTKCICWKLISATAHYCQ